MNHMTFLAAFAVFSVPAFAKGDDVAAAQREKLFDKQLERLPTLIPGQHRQDALPRAPLASPLLDLLRQ